MKLPSEKYIPRSCRRLLRKPAATLKVYEIKFLEKQAWWLGRTAEKLRDHAKAGHTGRLLVKMHNAACSTECSFHRRDSKSQRAYCELGVGYILDSYPDDPSTECLLPGDKCPGEGEHRIA